MAAAGRGASHLPNGASTLSAPQNEISGIRSQAAKARHASHQNSSAHHHTSPTAASPTAVSSSYDSDLQASQKLYDRRFNSSEPSYPHPSQQHNGGGGNGHLPAAHTMINQAHLNPANNMGRSTSPAPSGASEASRAKDKKKLKNLFSSKK